MLQLAAKDTDNIRPLRIVIAISLLSSMAACTSGPTRPPFRPASATSSGMNKSAQPGAMTPSTAAANVTPSPQVSISPLQSPEPPQSTTLAAEHVASIETETIKVSRTQAMQGPHESQAPQELQVPQAAQVSKVSASKGMPNAMADLGSAKGNSVDVTTRQKNAASSGVPMAAENTAQESRISAQAPGVPSGQVDLNQCWGQVTLVPKSTRKVVQLVTEQAHTRYKLAPAKLRSEQLAVVVKDAAQTYKLEQPQFVQVTESVKVQEEYKRLVVDPAVYKTEEEDVLIESARVGLRPCAAVGARLMKSIAGPQTSAQCSYEIPARYRKVLLQKLIKPETVREEVVPAVYKNITKLVLAEPAKVLPIDLPAKTVQMPYSSVEVPSAATPEDVKAVTIKLDVTEYEKKSPQLAWQRVLCEGDLDPTLIRDLQNGLVREGKLPGAQDGKLGLQTLLAAKDFQRSKGIESNYIVYQLLEWLGIQPGKTTSGGITAK